ncbi:uncharacterized protein LOC134534972 [Bacillus rossius redtenbacheri]|uniref:uncharacterized protein LOC134534972 n=1 Tax=Bacillus rossius redtenbacheri TaxID=93214 RepID=UPI002FDDA855
MSTCVLKCLRPMVYFNYVGPFVREYHNLIYRRTLLKLPLTRFCHEDSGNSKDKDKRELPETSNSIPLAVSSKYKVFRDEDSPIILDIEEERSKFQDEIAARLEVVEDEFSGINLKRGERGVFDTEELVALLRRDRAGDIFVAELPSHLKYVDHIVVATGKSHRHRRALAEFVRKVYKRKQRPGDPVPRIEGENATEWIALDLGNIALHIMSKSARELYDIEMLWSVGPEFDDQCNKTDDAVVSVFQHHAIYLGDLKPLENHG